MEIIVTVGPGSLDKITLGKLLESGATSSGLTCLILLTNPLNITINFCSMLEYPHVLILGMSNKNRR